MIDPNDMREVWVVEATHVVGTTDASPFALVVCFDVDHARVEYKDACRVAGPETAVSMRGPFAPGEDLMSSTDRRVVLLAPAAV